MNPPGIEHWSSLGLRLSHERFVGERYAKSGVREDADVTAAALPEQSQKPGAVTEPLPIQLPNYRATFGPSKQTAQTVPLP